MSNSIGNGNSNDESKLKDISDFLPNDAPLAHNNDNNGNGGGKDMDKYATKEELKTLETKIDGQFNTLNAKLDGQVQLINEKFGSVDIKFDSLPDKIKLIVKDSEDKQKKEINDNRKFIWGTIIIGGLATLASIASVIVSLIK